MAQWNLAQLGKALSPLCDDLDPLRRTIDAYIPELSAQYRHTMLRKLGLSGLRTSATEDDDLLTDLGALLVEAETDMTLFFRALAEPKPTFGSLRGPTTRPSRSRRCSARRSIAGSWPTRCGCVARGSPRRCGASG